MASHFNIHLINVFDRIYETTTFKNNFWQKIIILSKYFRYLFLGLGEQLLLLTRLEIRLGYASKVLKYFLNTNIPTL